MTPTPLGPISGESGLVAWYNIPATGNDWDPINPTNGTLIKSWNDTSNSVFGGPYNITNGGDATKSPTYSTNIQNGLPSLLFDGVTDGLSGSTINPIASATGITMFVVAKTINNINSQIITTTAFGDLRLSIAGGTQRYQIGMAGALYSDDTSTVDNLMHIHTIIYDSTLVPSDGAIVYRRDRTQQTLTNVSGTIGNSTNSGSTQLFVASSPNFSQLFDGYISEIIIYNSVLNNQKITQTEKYLSDKWGIT